MFRVIWIKKGKEIIKVKRYIKSNDEIDSIESRILVRSLRDQNEQITYNLS